GAPWWRGPRWSASRGRSLPRAILAAEKGVVLAALDEAGHVQRHRHVAVSLEPGRLAAEPILGRLAVEVVAGEDEGRVVLEEPLGARPLLVARARRRRRLVVRDVVGDEAEDVDRAHVSVVGLDADAADDREVVGAEQRVERLADERAVLGV